MTSSDMDETIASSTSYVSVDMGQHKKRSSSTMSPPSTAAVHWNNNSQNPSDMAIDSHHPNATSSNNENDDDNGETYERPLKQPFRQLIPIDTTSHRHWSNIEQEALYVAVERHHLYGRWAEVKERMQLDRSLEEIEQEYTRIYGELPESDIDYDDDDDDDWSSSGYDPAPGSSSSSTGPTYRSSFPNLYPGSGGGAATPALTPASQSRRSSQEIYGSYPYPHSTHSSSRRPSYQTNRSMHSRSPDEGYDYDHDGGSDTRMRDRDSSYHATSPTTPKSRGTGSGKRGRGGGSAAAAADRAATAAAAAARGSTGDNGGDGKPTRTVRVWTLQQSEQLKNLIETCFPGGYRINWVWVASQMGNTFTRKQCKNKWEIMRRRAGTDEEIALLKRGHEEFGPSWSQIQEKYLPERSQGGISIMWGLLQAREEEEERKQHQQGPLSSSSGRDMSVDHVSPTTGSSTLGPMTPVSPTRSRKESGSASAGAGPIFRVDQQQQQQQQPRRSQTPSHISTTSVTSPTGSKKGASRRPSLTTPPYGASSRHHWPPE